MLRQDLLFSTVAKERFLAEARVSCSLSHPNIVRVHDVGVSGEYYYLSMERLKGHNLRQRIEAYRRENRAFGVLEVTDIARQLIDALRYAHRYIVHRDLKPENIWLAEDGTVKLMDFGIARAFSASQLTQTGMTLGTAYYMAPEQRIAAKDVDWRADQYALGVVLYELLAGTLPTGAVRPLAELCVAICRSATQRRSCERCRRSRRIVSARSSDLLTEIEPPARKTRAAAIIAIGAGLAAAAAGAFFVINRPADVAPAPAAETAATPEASQSKGEPIASAPVEQDDASAETASVETDETPPNEPPPADEAPIAAESADTTIAAPSADTKADAADADASSATPPQSRESSAAPAAPKPTQREPVADASAGDARRQQCITQCERDEGECRSINRRSKQDCMRAVAFNAVASARQQCEEQAHAADRRCMDDLRYCRAGCQ